ncbi:hypothetical protein [Amycolatopsis sp. 195334CR]|uniref:hypothetical protein n=1 Tax=Amycolatopsis sp. 195334CR TaxID=2814588 RepID=UPI001A90AE38|nr:hypothetical protein [Amycolatopsis sp. 195334CR]MBN6036569.1 hypothetical protein [Amycolatopsis sp. 195334CR]
MFPFPEGSHGAHQRSALEATIGVERVRAALAQGWLSRYSASVLVERRRFAEFRTRAAAALLHAGPQAALTGDSVFALAGFTSAAGRWVEVLVPDPRPVRRRPGLVIHSAEFSEIDVDVHAGLRAMTPDFALAELLSRDRGFACLEEALASCPPSRREGLRTSVLARIMARPDSGGRARARFLVDLGTGLTRSPLESRVLLLTVDAGWPRPVAHFPIRGSAGRTLYHLPLAWPDARVALAPEPAPAPEPTLAPGPSAAPGTAAAEPGTAAGEARADEIDAAREATAAAREAAAVAREAAAAQDEDLWRRGWTILRPTAADLRAPVHFLSDLHAALTQGGLAA